MGWDRAEERRVLDGATRPLPELLVRFLVPVTIRCVFRQIALALAALRLVECWTSCLVVRAPAVVAYWAAQGTFFFALFVVGHDCGHGSFSAYPLLNDLVGTVTHGVLMVPYYQWKLSHRNHHKNTANIDKDEVFYPVRRSQQREHPRLLPGFALGVGWFIYLVAGYGPMIRLARLPNGLYVLLALILFLF